jgi:hypothetical protein
MSPIALTDEQMEALLAAARPLPRDRRSAFLEHVARELASAPMLGGGAVHGVVAERIYFVCRIWGAGTTYRNIAD